MLICELKAAFNNQAVRRVKDYYFKQGPDLLDPAIHQIRLKQRPKLDELTERLEALGWDFVGSGSFSIVFAKPGVPYVLKVNKMNDPGFALFANVLKKFPNKHFPRIGKVKSFSIDGLVYKIYLVEKLRPLTGITGNIAQTLSRMAWTGNIQLAIDLAYPEVRDILEKQPGLITATEIIRANRNETLDIDLHSANVMQRKDGTIVIIDPYA